MSSRYSRGGAVPPSPGGWGIAPHIGLSVVKAVANLAAHPPACYASFEQTGRTPGGTVSSHPRQGCQENVQGRVPVPVHHQATGRAEMRSHRERFLDEASNPQIFKGHQVARLDERTCLFAGEVFTLPLNLEVLFCLCRLRGRDGKPGHKDTHLREEQMKQKPGTAVSPWRQQYLAARV
jgi:hypothetical protein